MKRRCPNCLGYKFLVSPRVHMKVADCVMCMGTGFVNPDYVCKCGRPGLRQVADQIVCTANRCADDAMGVVAK
jgi:hypothetical protein